MARIWLVNQYASTPKTGIGGRPHHLARELAGFGHDVVVVAAREHHLLHDPAASVARPTVEEVDGYRFVRLAVPRYAHAHDRRRILAWFAFAWALRRLPNLLGDRPDAILYSSPSLVGFLGAERLARRTGARLVFEVRDIWPLTLVELGGTSPRHPFIRLLQRIEDRAYRVSDRVVANLPLAHRHMVARGMDPAKFAWIPNGVPADALVEPPAPASGNGFVVGYAGTLGLANALEVLVEAARRLRNHADIRFELVGGGREKPALERSAVGLPNVVFRAPVPKADVPCVLGKFDACFIGLAKSSVFRFGVSPNKLFDYLAAARPVIYAIDSGEYRPVADAGAGIEVPPGDPEALAAAILKLKALPPDERRAMGARGRRLVEDVHEYGAIARRLEGVLLSERSCRAPA